MEPGYPRALVNFIEWLCEKFPSVELVYRAMDMSKGVYPDAGLYYDRSAHTFIDKVWLEVEPVDLIFWTKISKGRIPQAVVREEIDQETGVAAFEIDARYLTEFGLGHFSEILDLKLGIKMRTVVKLETPISYLHTSFTSTQE